MVEGDISNGNYQDTFDSLYKIAKDPPPTHSPTFTEKNVTDKCATSDPNTQKDTNENGSNNKIGSYRCALCKKTFVKAKQYYGHLRVHSKDRPWMCSSCPGENFPKKSLLDQHKKVAHPNTFDQRFFCSAPQCFKFLVSTSLLQYRERFLHSCGRSHICKICGIGFFKRSYLKEHAIVHEDTKCYSCKTCKKSFTNVKSLKTHERSHSAKTTYKCGKCLEIFSEETSLKKHDEQRHTDIAATHGDQSEPILLSENELSLEESIAAVQSLDPPQQSFPTDQVNNPPSPEKPYSAINDTAIVFDNSDTDDFNMKDNQIEIEKDVIEGIFTSLEDCPQFLDSAADKTKPSFDSCQFFDENEIAMETEKIIDELDISIKDNDASKVINEAIVQSFDSKMYTGPEDIKHSNGGKNDSDLLATSYNLVNFELLATLEDGNLDNNEYLNVDDLNPSSFNVTDVSLDLNNKQNITDIQLDNAGTNGMFFDQDLISFLNSTDAQTVPEAQSEMIEPPDEKEENNNLDNKVVEKTDKIHGRPKNKNKSKKINRPMPIGNYNHSEQSSKTSDSINNILNIKSVVNDKTVEEMKIPNHIDDIPKLPCDTSISSENLQKLASKDVLRLQVFATEDKDTYVISINSDMEAEAVEKLIKEGLLSIDINEEEDETNQDVDNQLSSEFLDTETCDTIFKNVDELFDDSISLDGDSCQPTSQEQMMVENQTMSNDYQLSSDSETTSKDRQTTSTVCDTILNDCQTISRECETMSDNCEFDSLINLSDTLLQSKDVIRDGMIEANESSSDVSQSKMENKSDLPTDKRTDDDVVIVDVKKDKLVKRKVYMCSLCNKIFDKKDNYQSHMGGHEGGTKRHKCSDCNEKFAWRSTLTRHISAKHGPRTDCPYCPQSYTTLSQVRQHIHQVHLHQKKYKCEMPDCGQTFSKSAYLKIHYRSHTKERPYKCRLCGASFSFSSHRLRHERTHNTPPPPHGQRVLRCSQVDFATGNLLKNQWNIKSH